MYLSLTHYINIIVYFGLCSLKLQTNIITNVRTKSTRFISPLN